MSFPSTFHEAITFRNMFFMVKSTVVRGRLLFLLATVLVCRAGGKPSTWFPPGTRRAVNASDKFSYHFLLQELCNFKVLNQIF